MGVKITNNASGTLAAAITSGATTLTLTTGQGALFPTLGVGDYSWCTLVDTSNNVEIIKVTARSTDTLTMTRGQDGTTARAFAINDRLELRPTAALFAEFADPDVGGDLSGTASNAQIVANAVGTAEIANSAVTDAKIAGMSSSKLSGALPAIDGSALTGVANTPSFSATSNTSQSLSQTVFTKIVFGSELFDTDSAYTSSRFTVPSGEGGRYFINSSASIDSQGNGNLYVAQTAIYKNGGPIKDAGSNLRTGYHYHHYVECNGIFTLSAGDYIEIYAYIHAVDGTGGQIRAGTYTAFSMFKLIGA